VTILLLLLVLFGFAYGGSGSFSSGTTAAVPAARVPAVTGLYPQYADRALRKAGLVPRHRFCTVASQQYAVVRQRPRAGAVVPRKTSVRLFLVPALGSGVRHPLCRTFANSRP
jgi:beta-lactam-binding protein with PASTA domain